MAAPLGRLGYLYVGTADFKRDLELQRVRGERCRTPTLGRAAVPARGPPSRSLVPAPVRSEGSESGGEGPAGPRLEAGGSIRRDSAGTLLRLQGSERQSSRDLRECAARFGRRGLRRREASRQEAMREAARYGARGLHRRRLGRPLHYDRGYLPLRIPGTFPYCRGRDRPNRVPSAPSRVTTPQRTRSTYAAEALS